MLQDGKTFYFNLDGSFLIGFVSENGVVTKKIQKSTHVHTAGFANMLFLVLTMVQDDVDCTQDLWAESVFCADALEVIVIVAPPNSAFGPIRSMIIHYPVSIPDAPVGGGGGTSCPVGMTMVRGVCVKDPCIKNRVSNPLSSIQIEGKPNSGIDGARFGDERGSPHNGIDFTAAVGTPVFATHNGIVSTPFSDAHIQGEKWSERKRWNYDKDAAGNRVWINSSGYIHSWRSGYFHLSGVLVRPGDVIRAGQVIGYTGTTGSASSKSANPPHLHYELKKDGIRVDPEGQLPADTSGSDGADTNNCS
jgi:hypothetical protein